MKKLQLKRNLLMYCFILGITVLSSCDKNKDKEKDLVISPELLEGTIWESTVTDTYNKEHKNISILFIDKENGKMYVEDKLDMYFTYKVGKNNIDLTPERNYNSTIIGVWWVAKFAEKEMVWLGNRDSHFKEIVFKKTFK